MHKTLFSVVPNKILDVYKEHGFSYEDPTYINVFRWIWNDLHYHPEIMSFPGDKNNRTFVSLERKEYNKKPYKIFVSSYDDAIINIVEHIAKNYDDYLM